MQASLPRTATPTPSAARLLRAALPCLALGVLTACGGLTNSSTTSAPVIGSFAPTAMTVGNNVVLTGSGFTNTESVTLNGLSVPTWVVNSDTQLTLQVPTNAVTGTFIVTTTAGTVASGSSFTVIPQISGFTPTSGPVGTQVTISGSGFVGATSVTFGTETVSAYSPQVLTANELYATVDANAPIGADTIQVVASGVTATSEENVFTVTAQ